MANRTASTAAILLSISLSLLAVVESATFVKKTTYSAAGCAASALKETEHDELVTCREFGKTPQGTPRYLTQRWSGGQIFDETYNMSGCTGAPYGSHANNVTCKKDGSEWVTKELLPASGVVVMQSYAQAGCKGAKTAVSHQQLDVCNPSKKNKLTCDGSKVTFTSYTDATCTTVSKVDGAMTLGVCPSATLTYAAVACKTKDGKTIVKTPVGTASSSFMLVPSSFIGVMFAVTMLLRI
eukprot:TRINITY_DN49829_c0_g1_i1.p1 TRINITY_DN49829_c0_g1~~TRINITY_DN49829_c0_g1_i1.p1  ORF type:complete len:239 (+),score=23.83 TRINITY_DN49829_c0_g1_i1:67-783(+)